MTERPNPVNRKKMAAQPGVEAHRRTGDVARIRPGGDSLPETFETGRVGENNGGSLDVHQGKIDPRKGA